MQLEFEISEAEYFEAIQTLRRKPADWYKPLRIGGIVSTATGLALLFAADSRNWAAPMLLILFGLFVPIYPFLRGNSEQRGGWSEYSKTGRVVWEFSADVVSFRSEQFGAWWKWDAFERYSETSNLFIFNRKKSPYLISKRAFDNDEQLRDFRSLLREKFSRPTGGFPVQPI